MLNGLQFVMSSVPSIAAVRSFYTDTLGFTVEDEQPGFIQFAQPNGATFSLGEGPITNEIELWWYVDDADAVCNQMREQGVPVVMPPTDMPFGRAFAVTDPAGRTLHFLQMA